MKQCLQTGVMIYNCIFHYRNNACRIDAITSNYISPFDAHSSLIMANTFVMMCKYITKESRVCLSRCVTQTAKSETTDILSNQIIISIQYIVNIQPILSKIFYSLPKFRIDIYFRYVYELGPVYWHKLSRARTGMSTAIHSLIWDVITHSLPNFSDGLIKPPLKLEYGWLITSQCFGWMYLCVHALIPMLVLATRPIPTSTFCVWSTCVQDPGSMDSSALVTFDVKPEICTDEIALLWVQPSQSWYDTL